MHFSWRDAKQWIVPKLIIGALAALIIFVVAQSFFLWYKSYQTNQHVSDLKKELARMEEQHKHLDSFRAFLESDFFAEQEARVKLGMQKAGERVVVVPQGTAGSAAGTTLPPASERQEDVLGIQRDEPLDISGTSANNRWNWWNYFFGDRAP